MCTGKIRTKPEYKNDRYEELSSERILKNYAMKTYNYKGNWFFILRQLNFICVKKKNTVFLIIKLY